MTVQIFTAVLSAAGSYDLVDLDTAKSELGIDPLDTTKDDWLGRAIDQVSSSIASFCNRVFPIEQLQDLAYIQQDPYPYQTPGGFALLQLSRWPLVNFTILPLAGPAAVGDTTLNLGSAAGAPGIVSAPGLPPGSTAGLANGVLTLNQPVAGAMPAGTPIAFGIEVKRLLANYGGIPTEQVLTANADYRIDAERGQLLRLDRFSGANGSWEAVPTTITYSAGYAAIPPDVVVAALRWINWRWAERGRDPTLKEITQPLVGQQTFWVGGPPMSGGVPLEIGNLLWHYRPPVVA